MISTNEFKTNVTVTIDGDAWQVVEFQHVKPGLSALHLIITAEARPLLSQEPLFLQPLPLFMKKCRSPVHAKRKRSATSLFQKTSP